MGSINKQISRYEFTAVYTHPDARVDVVLVHGLNGDPERSWRSGKNGVFWPADLLPVSLRNKRANILVYGYNADVFSSRNDRSASDNFIHQHAQTMVTAFTHYRKSEGSVRNPIIWVAHSLGGILVKRALLYSNDLQADHAEDFRCIFVSTYGIIFLGTPHAGSDLAAWGRIIQSMSDAVVPRKFFETESVLLKSLKKDSETLQTINSHFLDIYQRFRIHMAHENHKTDVRGTKVLVVDSSSASLQLPGVTYYGIEASHTGLSKFDSPAAPGYLTVSTAIREWVVGSLHRPSFVCVGSWRTAIVGSVRAFRTLSGQDPMYDVMLHCVKYRSKDMLTAALMQNAQLVSQQQLHAMTSRTHNATVQTSDPEPLSKRPGMPLTPGAATKGETQSLFIHPEFFRPNSFFVGRTKELESLHLQLTDQKRRLEGTSAVVVRCLPGGGKTHLAREYVFLHRQDYSAVYWIQAKSLEEMEYFYWLIAKNEVLQDPDGYGLGHGHDGMAELVDSKKMVESVRQWLNSQENWLMVLDGVQFDMEGLQDFLPDSRNTSLIYTSTDRAVTGDPRFDNPTVIELGLLSAEDARDLLLLEMDKKKPWTRDDQARALELVQLMGRLPIMIHVAAKHLKATREPLSKYLRSYRARSLAGTLPAYRAVREQLHQRGANASLNLMSVLAFFDQDMPVEMLTFGIPALRKATPIKTTDASRSKPTLDSTLRTLMAFALVERVEGDDMSTASCCDSSRSFDNRINCMDLLRVHSVVQAFFVESLVEDEQAEFWLERAATVWCTSFDEADRRIKGDATRVGLPDDYRRYSIHGQKLLGHLDRFDRKSHDIFRPVRGRVVARLEDIAQDITRLSYHVQASLVDGPGEVLPVSVFERSSNTTSQTDSARTPSTLDGMTNPWQLARNGFDQDDVDDGGLPTLPFKTGPQAPDETNPYHWHVPYPQTEVLMPALPDVDEEDVLTPTPTPERTPSMTILKEYPWLGQEETPGGIKVPTETSQRPRSGSLHRKLALNQAWQARGTGDARVSISREQCYGRLNTLR